MGGSCWWTWRSRSCGSSDVLVQTLNSVVSSGTETHIIRSSISPEALETDQYPRYTPHGPQLRGRGVAWRGPQPHHAPAG